MYIPSVKGELLSVEPKFNDVGLLFISCNKSDHDGTTGVSVKLCLAMPSCAKQTIHYLYTGLVQRERTRTATCNDY